MTSTSKICSDNKKPILKDYETNETRWTLDAIIAYSVPFGLALYAIGLFIYEGWFRYSH